MPVYDISMDDINSVIDKVGKREELSDHEQDIVGAVFSVIHASHNFEDKRHIIPDTTYAVTEGDDGERIDK